MTKLIPLSFTIAIASAALVAPTSAADRFISDGARNSNTYQTYLPGQRSCVEDLGYGRVREGCGGE